MSTISSLATEIKAQIVSDLQAANGVGLQLDAAVTVRPSTFNGTGLYPFVGVGFVGAQEVGISTDVNAIMADFAIVVSVKGDSTTTIEATEAIRDTLIDDGNGNGVEPLLRVYHRNLMGGLIASAQITQFRNTVTVNKGSPEAPTEWFAESYIIFRTTQGVQF